MSGRTALAQFVIDCRKHGNPNSLVIDCARLCRLARTHHRLVAEDTTLEDDALPVKAIRQKIIDAAAAVGAKAVLAGGDPRGCVCKLVWEDGATNDFVGEGWCVPTD